MKQKSHKANKQIWSAVHPSQINERGPGPNLAEPDLEPGALGCIRVVGRVGRKFLPYLKATRGPI